MRPDKPGYWWHKMSDGIGKIVDIASGRANLGRFLKTNVTASCGIEGELNVR